MEKFEIPISDALDLREFLNSQSAEDLRHTFFTYADSNMIRSFSITVTRYQDGFRVTEYKFA